MAGQEIQTSTQKCHLCGTPIGAQPYIREGNEYCCERCYLSSIGGHKGGVEENDDYLGVVGERT